MFPFFSRQRQGEKKKQQRRNSCKEKSWRKVLCIGTKLLRSEWHMALVVLLENKKSHMKMLQWSRPVSGRNKNVKRKTFGQRKKKVRRGDIITWSVNFNGVVRIHVDDSVNDIIAFFQIMLLVTINICGNDFKCHPVKLYYTVCLDSNDRIICI